MRILTVLLVLIAVLLEVRVWTSDQGLPEVARLKAAVQSQSAANLEQRERNRQLLAEVNDLKGGMTALEERARSELGMVGSGETFYQVVTPATPAPAAPPSTVTARAQ